MKPEIICYMMMSLDGRVDCGMTAQLAGNSKYYQNLHDFNLPTTLSGHTTAKLEMALPGSFAARSQAIYGQEGFSRKTNASGYEVIVDTKGDLLWDQDSSTTKPHLIITSEQVTKDYLTYLDQQNISWIATGKKKIDLPRAMEILAEQFGVQRMGVVGGPRINTAFLNAGLLSEINILVGPGIDGRADMPSVFEGRTSAQPLPLKLFNVKAYDDGAVLLQYKL